MLFKKKSASDHKSPGLDCKNLVFLYNWNLESTFLSFEFGLVMWLDLGNGSLSSITVAESWKTHITICFSDLVILPPCWEKAQFSPMVGEGTFEIESIYTTATFYPNQPPANLASKQRCMNKTRRDQGKHCPTETSSNSQFTELWVN